MIFEYLVEFREFERFSRIWLVLVYLNDFRLFWMNFDFWNDSSSWMIFEFFNDFRLTVWYSRIWMILEYLHVFRVINDFRVLEWFSSIWMNFEPLHDFLAFEFGEFDWFFIDFGLFELLPSIPMIVEYLNDYRDFWSLTWIWKIFEYLDEIRVHDWFYSILMIF